ncbi:unnamed protein product, partial [Tetraodon nigroviridis]
MKSHYEGKKSTGSPQEVEEKPSLPADKQQLKKKKKTEETEKDVSKVQSSKSRDDPLNKPNSSKTATKTSAKKPNRLQESRKKALLEANEDEDREIKRLERCLGFNKRKNKKNLPQSFVADGLDYILGMLDSGAAAAAGFQDGEEEEDDMDTAREKFQKLGDDESELLGDDDEEDEIGSEATDEGSLHENDLEKEESEEDEMVDEEDGMDETGGAVHAQSRKDMNDTLTEVLLAACVTPALMPDRLLMEHVLLISILHHSVGLEVGANFLETVVRKFDEAYKNQTEGKETDNLLAIVSHLYNFQVVHSLLIFDILKLLVKGFSEKDVELVLFTLRNVGFALRKDDALALKELISAGQRKAGEMGSKLQDQTRVRFMLETMLALKNNDMRKIPGYNPEPVERLRKLQKSLHEYISQISQAAGGSDMKLRVSLDNLLAAEQVGRWWIVGSSWSGAPMINEDGKINSQQSSMEGQFSANVLKLARKQRMNTEVRRNIFCVIMTSEDYLDAFEKLLGMGLKDKQEREIVHVLLDCCLQEKAFNAYYAVLGEKFCSYDRRFQMTFQFSLWDKFKELANLPSSTFNNLSQLLTCFLQKKCLSISILKVIEFGELDKPTVRFLRQVLTKLLKDCDPEDISSIFGRISGIPKLGLLREGLKLFISHFLLKSARARGPAEDAALLAERAQVATKALETKE